MTTKPTTYSAILCGENRYQVNGAKGCWRRSEWNTFNLTMKRGLIGLRSAEKSVIPRVWNRRVRSFSTRVLTSNLGPIRITLGMAGLLTVKSLISNYVTHVLCYCVLQSIMPATMKSDTNCRMQCCSCCSPGSNRAWLRTTAEKGFSLDAE